MSTIAIATFCFLVAAVITPLVLGIFCLFLCFRVSRWRWERFTLNGLHAKGIVTEVQLVGNGDDASYVVSYRYPDVNGNDRNGSHSWPIGLLRPNVSEEVSILYLPKAPWESIPEVVLKWAPRV